MKQKSLLQQICQFLCQNVWSFQVKKQFTSFVMDSECSFTLRKLRSVIDQWTDNTSWRHFLRGSFVDGSIPWSF